MEACANGQHNDEATILLSWFDFYTAGVYNQPLSWDGVALFIRRAGIRLVFNQLCTKCRSWLRLLAAENPCAFGDKELKNRRLPKYLLVLFVLAIVSSPVAATPAYFGYTGLMLTPTADTLKMGGANFGAVFLNNDNNNTFLSGNVGLLDSLEVGAALVSQEHGDSNGIINAKFRLLKETVATPALAVGWSDLTDQLDSTPYVVASKSLPLIGKALLAPRLSVGVGGGRLDGLFAGLSAELGSRTQLMVEYDTNDLNFGVQFAAGQGLRLQAGLIGGDSLGLGINYNAGF